MSQVLDYQSYRGIKHFPNLDGLRCFSILAIIWHHSIRPSVFLPMAERGFLGVDMFFVLSGFLIVTLILREKDKFGNLSLKKFYARRTLRIFPIYYGFLFFLSALLFFKNNEKFLQLIQWDIPVCLLYLSNWLPVGFILGITWSLATEEQFYLFWPPIEKYFFRYAIPIILFVIFVSECVNFRLTKSIELALGLDYEKLHILQVTFAPIALGVLLAHVLHSERSYQWLQEKFGKPWMPLAMFSGLLLVMNIPSDNIAGTIRLSTHLLMTGFLASCVMYKDHFLSPVLENRWIVRMGTISYGMYLYHMVAIHLGNGLMAFLNMTNIALHFPINLLFTIMIAEPSFRYIEKPLLSLKKKWSR